MMNRCVRGLITYKVVIQRAESHRGVFGRQVELKAFRNEKLLFAKRPT